MEGRDCEGNASVDEVLTSLGATPEQIAEARRGGHLAGLAADVVFASDASLSANAMAKTLDVPVDSVVTVWRLLGIPVTDVDAAFFSERDAELTAMIFGFERFQGFGGDELLRVMGNSMGRMAEAAVSVYVQTVEPAFAAPGVGEAVWASDLADTALKALRVGDYLGTLFIHHLRDAIARQRLAQVSGTEPSLFRLAVGFVDLVGFTPLSQRSTPTELLTLIGRFEADGFEIATAEGGRVVKHIGDEIMFVALDAAAGCRIAAELVRRFTEQGIEPRGGLAFGELITRHGDYYGPIVNLAARLVDLAIPGEVLVDAPVVSAASRDDSGLAFIPGGRRLPKGFDEPVAVSSLVIA